MMINSSLLKILLRLGIGIVLLFVLFQLVNFMFPLPGSKKYSKEILASDGTLLTAYITKDQKWRMQSSLEEISPD